MNALCALPGLSLWFHQAMAASKRCLLEEQMIGLVGIFSLEKYLAFLCDERVLEDFSLNATIANALVAVSSNGI